MMVKAGEHTVKATPEETRTRILDATREIYAQKGFRGTTTREVAERAAVNEATLFRHFGNKEALIEAMFQNACSEDQDALVEFFQASGGDIAIDLRKLALHALERMAVKRDLILIALAEEPRDPTAFNMMWRSPSAVYEGLTTYFSSAVERGIVRGDPAVLARFFMGMLFAHIMGRRIFGTPNYEEVADYCVDIFLNGILASNEAKIKENERGIARD
jgi:AcrR family transcriptional regulator